MPLLRGQVIRAYSGDMRSEQNFGYWNAVYLVCACFLTLALFACATTSGDRYRPGRLEPYERDERWLVGILAVQGEIPAESSYTGILTAALQEYGRYRIIEQEQVRALLEQAEFQRLSGMVDTRTAQQMGSMIGAEAVCITTVEHVRYSEDRTTAFIAWIDRQAVELRVTSRIIHVSSGEVLAATESSVERGRSEWVAFGFLRRGGFVEQENLRDEAMAVALQTIATGLSERAPRR